MSHFRTSLAIRQLFDYETWTYMSGLDWLDELQLS